MKTRLISSRNYGVNFILSLLQFIPDKFDQFWAVNRKLMEVSGDESFKYIPFRCYREEETFLQRLVKPLTEEGQRKTLLNLLEEVYPNEKGYFSFS